MCGINSKSCGRPFVVGLLVLGLLLAPSLAYASPPQSSTGVTLSQNEYDEVVAKIQAADKALEASSLKIAAQEKDLKQLWTFSKLLVVAAILEGVAATITAIKK